MRALRAPSTWIAVAAAAGAAAWVVHSRLELGMFPANDLYAYFYPKLLYALACLRDGGRGLLWNPFQNCGQPFFATSQTGLLYPPYWVFLLFDPERGLTILLWTHLAIGGIGTYALARHLGARPAAALAAVLAFEMGNSMIALTVSSPTHAAPYAWMPVAILACERLLQRPTQRRAAVLAVVLAIAILPGMPQTVFFIYQIIALRVLWELASAPVERRAALLGAVALGVGLPVLLAAVQLLPEIEVARASLRNSSLSVADLGAFGIWDPHGFQRALLTRGLGQPFLPIPCMLAAAAVLAPPMRRSALFYAGVALLFFALSLGPGTPLFDLYSRLPAASAFRGPSRFVWITSFAVAVTAALGVESLLWSWQHRQRRVLAIAFLLLPLAALWLVARLSPEEIWRPYEELLHVRLAAWQLVFAPSERWAAAAVVATALVAALRPGAAGWAGPVLLAAMLVQVIATPRLTSLFQFPHLPRVRSTEAALAPLAQRLTPQDRVYMIPDSPASTRFEFIAKTPSLLRLPGILDYEPLASARYAELSVMMRSGARIRRLNDFLMRGPGPRPQFSRRLLDLTATRFVVASPRFSGAVARIEPHLLAQSSADDLLVWENPQRLPRAFYVPRVEVVVDPAALLDRLATGTEDLRQVAMIEAPPPSGFTGSPRVSAADTASVEFVRNDPENISLEVDAPARGFVVLSDQYFPGWFATVNGQPAPIQRANYAFRLVEVPAGASIVAFHYSPRSLWLGAGLSLVGALLTAIMLRPRRRRQLTAR
jgi:hypothetical protein